MLKSLDEIKNVELEAGVVINGVDNANLMSVDSTEPVETVADTIDTPETGVITVGDKKEAEGEKEEEEGTKKKEEEKETGDDSLEEEEETNAEKKEEKKEEKVDDNLASKPNDSKKVQKRIGTLTKNWRTAERERDYEISKRLEIEAKLEELTTKIPVEDKPQKVDFEDEDDYIEALTDWKIETKLKQSQQKKAEIVKNKEEKDEVLDTYNGLDEAVERGKEKYDDFDELVFEDTLVLSPVVAQIALDTENPEDVLYYLASNPEESERISKLDPIRGGMEIGKIDVELRLKNEKKEEKKEEPKQNKKQSKAPAPISSVRADGVVEKDPNKMNAKEYRAWRESQK